MAASMDTDYELYGVEDTGVELGRGSYATVLSVRYKGLVCAAKKIHDVLLTSLLEDNVHQRRYLEECRLLSKLRHPNIVQFLGIYHDNSSYHSTLPVLVMEYLPMGTLAKCVDQYGVLPNEISYSLLQDVALALTYLHQHDPPIIHRDLSANNVLLTRDLSAKISDLGVARMIDFTRSSSQSAMATHSNYMTQAPGTMSYMPPEALVPNARYSEAVDVFSCGVLMLHVFSGKWPLPTAAVREDPADSSRLIPLTEADRRQENVDLMGGDDHPSMGLIRRCVAFNPDKRPKAAEVLRGLGELGRKFPSSGNRIELLKALDDFKTKQKSSLLVEESPHISSQNDTTSHKEQLKYENTLLRDQQGMKVELQHSEKQLSSCKLENDRLLEERAMLREKLDSALQKSNEQLAEYEIRIQQLAEENDRRMSMAQEIFAKRESELNQQVKDLKLKAMNALTVAEETEKQSNGDSEIYKQEYKLSEQHLTTSASTDCAMPDDEHYTPPAPQPTSPAAAEGIPLTSPHQCSHTQSQYTPPPSSHQYYNYAPAQPPSFTAVPLTSPPYGSSPASSSQPSSGPQSYTSAAYPSPQYYTPPPPPSSQYSPAAQPSSVHNSTGGTHKPEPPSYTPHPLFFANFRDLRKTVELPLWTISQLKEPMGVTVSGNGEILIVEYASNCVTVYTSDGKQSIRRFFVKGTKRGQVLRQPRGITCDDRNCIFVTEQHCLTKFSAEGGFISTVGTKGNGPLQFNGLQGIAYNRYNSAVYVCDKENHRVQVLSCNLQFKRSFGQRGNKNGQFCSPMAVAVDVGGEGRVFVADTNHAIQIFKPEGTFLSKVDSSEVNTPRGLLVEGGLMFVADSGKKHVQIFTTAGKFLKTLTKYSLNEPYGIAKNKDGNILVTDKQKGKMFVIKYST